MRADLPAYALSVACLAMGCAGPSPQETPAPPAPASVKSSAAPTVDSTNRVERLEGLELLCAQAHDLQEQYARAIQQQQALADELKGMKEKLGPSDQEISTYNRKVNEANVRAIALQALETQVRQASAAAKDRFELEKQALDRDGQAIKTLEVKSDEALKKLDEDRKALPPGDSKATDEYNARVSQHNELVQQIKDRVKTLNQRVQALNDVLHRYQAD